MESTNLAEVATANFELNRLLIEIQRARSTSSFTEMESRIAVQSRDLALTRYQQAQISLVLEVALNVENSKL